MRKAQHLRVTVAALAAAVALALSACSAGATSSTSGIQANPTAADTKGTITVMGNPAETTPDVIKAFEKKYPKVKVQFQTYDAVKLKALEAAGTPPDVFRTEGPGVAPLVAQGQLMDLTVPFKDAGISDSSTYGAAGLYVVNGKRYGIPKDWSPDFTVYVNNKMFRAAGIPIPDPSTPLSWSRLAELASKLTVKTGSKTTQFGLGGAWDTFSPARTIQAMLAESGATLYSKDEKSIQLASNPAAVKALQYMADLAKSGVTHSPSNPSASYSGDDFTKGTVAMVIYGYWFNAILDGGKTSVGTDYTVLRAPYWTSPNKQIDPTITGTGYVMSAKTKNANAAWAFLRFYLTGDQAKQRAATGFGYPILKANAALLPQTSAVDKQAYAVASKDAERSPALQFNKYYDDSVFTASYNKYLQDYINGSMTISDMASHIQSDVNSAIQDGVSQLQ